MLWENRVYRFESLSGDRARIRATDSADLRDVLVRDLRGLPSLSIAELNQRNDVLGTADSPSWTKAQRRETVIQEALQKSGSATAVAAVAASKLGVSTRTVCRLIARYTTSAQTTSLVCHPRGPKKSHRRLGVDRERVVDTAIEKRYLVRPRTPMEEVYKEVVRRCRLASLVPPARNTVLKRIRDLDARLVARRRLGRKSSESIALSTPGALELTDALEVVQIDHTLADVMIAAEHLAKHQCQVMWHMLSRQPRHRKIVGHRPYLPRGKKAH